jgi:uncharacterized protein HemY
MGKQTKRRWQVPQLTTKAKLLVGLVVFLFGGALIVYIVTSTLARQAIDAKGYDIAEIRKELENKTADERRNDTASLTYTAQRSGDRDKATDIYKQAIDVETDPTRKVRLAIDRADQLFKSKQIDAAIQVLKDAENYSDDKYLIAHQLGAFYMYSKKFSDAERYYTLARSRVDSPTNTARYTKTYYDEKIAELKQSAGENSEK